MIPFVSIHFVLFCGTFLTVWRENSLASSFNWISYYSPRLPSPWNRWGYRFMTSSALQWTEITLEMRLRVYNERCDCRQPKQVVLQVLHHKDCLFTGDWGEPERAPHIREVCEFCLSVCLSFITRQFTNVVLIYGVPSTVDCSFEDDVFCTVFVSTNTLWQISSTNR